MARNEISIAAAPERVFEVLSDPAAYARWVPGTRSVRDAAADWPADGSWFEYIAGTRVWLTEEPAHRVLRVLIGPLGHAIIRLRNLEALRRLKLLVEAT
jgi:uncharacterized protein YndB with AHSA1/START domain